jgi:hypothetical protein
LRDVNTICRRSWYIAAHVWKIYDFKIDKNIIYKIMEDVYMSIPVGNWRIALYKKILSNLCLGTCLFEPKVATPLKMDKKNVLN